MKMVSSGDTISVAVHALFLFTSLGDAKKNKDKKKEREWENFLLLNF